MINNNICMNCTHSTLCKIEDKISVFSDDAKKQLGVDVTIDNCQNYEEIKNKILN